MSSNFKYYTKETVAKEKFYKLPKAIMLEPKYKKVRDTAKILYSIFLDRNFLSIENDWFDEEGKAYVICTYDEIETLLGCSRKTVKACLTDLVNVDLIKVAKDVTTEGNKVNVYYVAQIDITSATLDTLLEQHKVSFKALSNKKKIYKKEYDKKQSDLNKAKRENIKYGTKYTTLKSEETPKCKKYTTVENTSFKNLESPERSDCNRSVLLELHEVEKVHYNKTDSKETDKVCLYVAKAEQLFGHKIVLDKKHKELLDSCSLSINLDLFEVIVIDAINKNKTIAYALGTMKNCMQENIITVEQYETNKTKSYEKNVQTKTAKSTSGSSTQVKTRYHNINQSFNKYTPEELEEVLRNSQKNKFKDLKEEPIGDTHKKTGFHNFEETFTKYSKEEFDSIVEKAQNSKYQETENTPTYEVGSDLYKMNLKLGRCDEMGNKLY